MTEDHGDEPVRHVIRARKDNSSRFPLHGINNDRTFQPLLILPTTVVAWRRKKQASAAQIRGERERELY
jgi:hypothetical protein